MESSTANCECNLFFSAVELPLTFDPFFLLKRWHLGRASAQTYEYQGRSYPPLSASATKVNEKAEISKALTIEEIEGIVKQYADAARFSVEAGFDGVEIHG